MNWSATYHQALPPRFPMTYCSQCGGEQGPGNAGFSHCDDHIELFRPKLFEQLMKERQDEQ